VLGRAWDCKILAVERIPDMETPCILSMLFDVLPLLRSQAIAEVVMCVYGTFIVCFSIFLFVSITLVLEISKLLIKCFHGNLTSLKWLAISQQEHLFNQIWLSFNLSGETYAATPSTNLTTSLGRRVGLGLLLKECVIKFPQFYPKRRSVILAGN